MSHDNDFQSAFNEVATGGEDLESEIVWAKSGNATITQYNLTRFPNGNGRIYTSHCYDFSQRILTSSNVSNSDSICVTPFAALDHEVLHAVRNKLIDLNGNPPPLPSPMGMRSPIKKSSM